MRQRNMAQMKGQNKAPEKELNKREVSDLSETEFILVIRMLKELKRIHFNSIKRSQVEMNALTEIRTIYRESTVEWMKPRIKSMIWNIREKKDIQSVQQKEKRIQKIEDSVKSHWNNFKHSNIRIIGMPEGEKKEQEIGNLVEKNNKKKTFLIW